jgi:3-hydroxyacyl-CoA dehydrogenase
MTISKVAVIGSGVMGSGIAAQIANAGVPVILLDIKPADGRDLARAAVERMLKADPAPFMHQDNARLITPGNLEDHLGLLAECDWIVEVVLEDLKVKHATYEKINRARKPGSIVSSNTSTIPLHHLVEPFGEAFARDFLITHFFNPPRYMRLLELVVGEKTRPEAIKTISTFCDVRLGKGVVPCHDTPGFIANRIGVFWLQSALNVAIADKVPVALADAVMGKPVGIPKTGVFGLLDLIGIDLMPHLAESMLSTLPVQDTYRSMYIDHPLIRAMITAGYTGRKGKGGFYRLDLSKGTKEKQVLDLSAPFSENAYRREDKVSSPAVDAGKAGLRAVLESPDMGGIYARKVLLPTLAYAASLVPDIADSVAQVDEAMRLGYNWKMGPFEMIDALGPAWFAQALAQASIPVPPLVSRLGAGTFYRAENGIQTYFGVDGAYHPLERPEGVLLLSDLKRATKPLLKNASASVWDIGDGVLCFEHTGKMNTFDDAVFDLLNKTIQTIGDGKGTYKALVIYNEGSAFSAGANLGVALFTINIALWPQVEEFVAGGQRAFKALKFAPFPVVAAPSGLALGGGCEILLHADHIQAHAETYCGLVEVGVGLIPGWGGCKEMILRYRAREKAGHEKMWFSPDNGPMGAVRPAFETIGTARVAKSAAEAREIGYLRPRDGITMNRDRLLFDAKAKALALATGYTPPIAEKDLRLPGTSGKMALNMAVSDLRKSGKATPHDVVVSDHLATVLSGGPQADWTVPLSEDDLLTLERAEFMKLLREPGTLARIEHMLDTGKPLRN